MKVNSRLIALMVAMAAGTAAAAGTTAGTVISNTATANFTDPVTNAPYVDPVTNLPGVKSNPVTTTVLPIAGFDIQYATTDPDKSNATNTGTNPIPTAYIVDGVIPTDSTKDQVATAYVAVNTGNVNNYVVNLSPVTGTLVPASVKYYPAPRDSNNDGTIDAGEIAASADTNNDGILTEAEVAAADLANKSITSVTIPADDVTTTGVNQDEGQVKFFQVIVVPNTATTGAIYAASPQGSAAAGPGVVGDPTYYPAVTEATTDLQFTQAIVTKPTVTLEPPDTDPTTPGVQLPPTPGTVPGTTTPDPNSYTPPTNPTVTPNPGTVVTVDLGTGNQDAYPKADGNPDPDIVTFVSAAKNGGTVPDTMVISVGLPAGATSVTVLDKNGVVINPVGGLYTLDYDPTTPGIQLTPAGESVPFQVVVTYPDSNNVAAPVDIVVPVGVFSGNVPSAPGDTGTLTIHPPQMVFGDTVAANTPNPALTPVETVTPGGATNTTLLTTADASAVFPVSIKNTGTYGDTFTLGGTVPILLTDGTTFNAPVTYFNANGSALATPGTTLVIAPNATGDYLAVVNIPSNAAATTGDATGINPEPSLTQTATGVYSTIAKQDTNDRILVAVVNTVPANASGIDVDKYQAQNATVPAAPTAANQATLNVLPGDTVRYAIIAKNNFNTPVANFVLSDSNGGTNNAYTFSNFVSALAAPTGFVVDTTAPFAPLSVLSANVLYKVNGGAWTATAPVAGTVISTLLVGVDTNNDTTIDANDVVPANASIRLDIEVTVK